MCKKTFVFFLGKGLQFIFIFIMVQGLFVPTAVVHADTADECAAWSREEPEHAPPRPGHYNPVSPLDRTLFPAPELLLIHASPPDAGNYVDFKYMTPDTESLENWAEWNHWINFDSSEFQMQLNDNRPVSSDSGHITAYDREQVAYAFFRADGQVEVCLWESQGSYSKRTTLPGSTATDSRSLDVVVGDLDGKIDEDSQFRDEIVVVRTGESDPTVCYVDVLDSNLERIAGDTISYPDGVKFVAATMGDFNWDGRLELAVAFSGDNGSCYIRLLRYTLSNGVLKTCSDQYIQPTDGNLDIAAGSFDGSGKDQLVMVWGQYFIYAGIFAINADETNFTTFYQNCLNGDNEPQACPGDLRVVTGHFDGDPNQGYNMNRREILVCYVECTNGHDFPNYIDCQIFDATDLTKMTRKHHHQIERSKNGHQALIRRVDVTVGNFVGHGASGDAESPMDQFAVSYQFWDLISALPCLSIATHQAVSIMGFDSGNTLEEITHRAYWTKDDLLDDDLHRTKYYYWSTVAAPDNTSNIKPANGTGDPPYPIGNSWVLGPPQHIVLDNVNVLNRVLGEPPKHVDFVPENPTDPDQWKDPEKWKVLNVSTFGDFNVDFKYEQTSAFTTGSSNTVSKDIGGSTTLDVEVSIGVPLAKVSVEYETKTSYDYESGKKNWNKNYKEKTFKLVDITGGSDEVTHSLVNFDVWRYLIIGLETGDPTYLNGFYELVFPSRQWTSQDSNFNIADWYQPIHSNHNVLTYPVSDKANNQIYFPEDMGSYSWDNATASKSGINTGAINDYTSFFSYDQNSAAQTISWDNVDEQGATRSYNNTLSSSQTITAGVSSECQFGGVSASASFNFHEKTSMGGENTAEQTDTQSTGITLNIPGQSLDNTDAAYLFNTIMYITEAGTLKVAHGVDLTSGSSSIWYKNVYGHSYDPGLNLPNRFTSHPDPGTGILIWDTLNEDHNRMRMLGCFLRSNTENAISKTYDFLGEAITADTPVRLCARVYNLSLNQDITHSFYVRFEHVLINTKDGTEIPETRQTIGKARINSLNARDWTEVYVLWDPVENNPDDPDPDDPEAYRFYVTVDPENQLRDEIHEWKDPDNAGVENWADAEGYIYSGNNEGYWPWNGGVTVHASDKIPEPGAPRNVHVKSESLSVMVDGKLENQDGVLLKKDTTYKLRAEVFFGGPSLDFTRVFFYDGNPEESGRSIGNPIIMGNTGNEGYAWAEWTPSEAGSYTLYLKVVEPHDDNDPGNDMVTLKVTVQDTASGGGSSGCFINSLMPGGGK